MREDGAVVLIAFPTDAVRRAERARIDALPETSLMRRASAAVASEVAAELRVARGGVYGRSVALLVGSGDNGGDALFAGSFLAGRGARVTAVLAGERAHPAGLAALRAAGGRVADDGAAAVHQADVVVDGLLGTGASRGLQGHHAEVARWSREARAVVAVDLASGVDPDTGELPGEHVRADVTVTMGAMKPALLLPPAQAAAGRVVEVDLGLAPELLGEPVVARLDAAGAAALWPAPSSGSHKYTRGVLGVSAGGDQYTGAAVLCVGAALHAGAGMVRFSGAEHPTALVRARWPEVVPGDGQVQAWVIGPGLDLEHAVSAAPARAALSASADHGLPLLVDAGALPLVVDHVRRHGPLDPARSPVLLTPHAGELARLIAAVGAGELTRAEVEAHPLRHARAAASATGATVLLKGPTTIVVPPQGLVWAQAEGPPWLATAGSGDVLAGIAGALLAAGLPPARAGALAATVHGRAADAANPGGPVTASAVSAAVPGVVADLLVRAGERSAHPATRSTTSRWR